MKNLPWSLSPITLNFALIAIAAQPLTAIAASNSAAINQMARSVVVRIVNPGGSGSGVMIHKVGKTYTVLTAAHVLASSTTYEVIAPDGQRYTLISTTVKKHPTADLAIAQFESTQTYPVATVATPTTLSEGSPSFVAGFPAKTVAMTESVYTFTTGEITANSSHPFADGYGLVYTNATLPGMSGGPIFNGNGALIGIHGRADAKIEMQDQSLNPSIYVKSGMNLGIPVQTLFDLIPKAQLSLVKPTLSPNPSSVSSPSATDQALIADLMAQSNFKVRQNDVPGAIAALDQVVRLDPANINAFNERGSLYLMQRNFLAAIMDFRQTVQLDPNFAHGYYNQGLAYLRSGSPREAYTNFKQAAELYKTQGKTEQYRATLEQLKGFSQP